MKCVELRLLVTRATVTAQLEGGGESEPEDIEVSALRKETISLFEDRLARESLSRRELKVLGWNLYDILFTGKVGRFFETNYRKIADQKKCLRVQLSFAEETGEVATLPWEYLYYPGEGGRKGFFFSVEGSLVLSRYVGQEGGRPTIQAKRPVNILVVLSTPASLQPESQDKVLTALETLHGEYNPKQLFSFRTVKSLRNLDDLESLFRQGDVDVLHFIGYGRYDQRFQTGEISLEDADAEPVWFPNEDFAASLTRQQQGTSPRLVILHLCSTGVPWQSDLKATFAGLARPLVLSGIPAVVAMQYPIAPSAAVMFLDEFYNRLAKEDPIDVAVQGARYKTAANNPKEYGRLLGTPIFYMQSLEGILIPPAEPGEEGAPGEDASAALRTGLAPTPSSLRERLLGDISNDTEATEEEKSRVLAFLDRVWTEDQASLEVAIRLRFSENDSPGQLAIYRRMLSTLKSERQEALT